MYTYLVYIFMRLVKLVDGISDSMDMSLCKLWKIPWTKDPGRLQSMGLLGVGHD